VYTHKFKESIFIFLRPYNSSTKYGKPAFPYDTPVDFLFIYSSWNKLQFALEIKLWSQECQLNRSGYVGNRAGMAEDFTNPNVTTGKGHDL
jgi:hypothetical protein